MAIFRFRTRDPERDRTTDLGRQRRLFALIDELSAEVEKERAGLARRLEAQSADAGFLDQSLDNGEGGDGASRRLGELSEALMNGQKRLEVLARQAGFLDGMRKQVDAFPK